MFGEAKVRAAKRLVGELRLDLARCYAYGDTANDRWLLEAVGRPAAVNPSKDLEGFARTRGWPVLTWEGREPGTQKLKKHRAIREKNELPSAIV
jgi:phosphoserine phosphatase